jgi:cell division protein FtsZ
MPQPSPELALQQEEHFIPPAAERIRPVRMPRVEELPAPAQNQIAAQARPVPAPPSSVEQKRVSLMQRLAAVGFGRKEEGLPTSVAPAQAPQLVAPQPAPSPAHAEYMRRPQPQVARVAQGQLDVHGRQQATRAEEDQLEIPAFLRRQGA